MNQILCFAAAVSLAFSSHLSAHCQVPCGIFDNDNVISSMNTDWSTIKKASETINKLSADAGKNAHQITRWVMNKESHAQAIQEKVLNYFLAQRIKLPGDEAAKEAYLKQLALCHEIIVVSMKCKQSTDMANVEKLHELLHSLNDHFGTKK